VHKINVYDLVAPVARRMTLARRGLLLSACLLALGLGGCGKKPGHVEPPAAVVTDSYPRTYPDPATDPKP